ncbi:MAG: metallophosphoesterase [Solirubrobacteraceae bacterium]|nr:metallophosphoesterase [Solirubrobacteraceae bacterium]
MVSMRGVGVAALVVTAAALPAVALADPAGKATTEETIVRGSGSGFVTLTTRGGESHLVRTDLAKPKSGRASRRSSLLMFAQVTDPQVADAMSPARIELFDPAGSPLTAAHRPQELLGAWSFDAVVRNINANRTSTIKPGSGKRGKVKFAISTGDLADNQQENEVDRVRTILDGGRVDTFSGKAISATNPCSGATPEQIAQMNAAVAARAYTGVQDYDDYPGVPPTRYAGFWDPDTASPAPGGLYGSFPRYPGLLDRALKGMSASGLAIPWYVAFGNHDALVQGNAPASIALIQTFSVGCLKPFPSAGLDPDSVKGKSESDIFKGLTDPTFLGQLLGGAKMVPPDPERRFLSKSEFKKAVGSASKNHGFGYQSPSVKKATNGSMGYYAFSPRKGVRFITLDTIAEGGGASGNLDDPQYKWLEKELKANKDNLVLISSHHTIATMNNVTPDEEAGACSATLTVGCDADPQKSTPIHQGNKGSKSVQSLLLKYPQVVAWINGHTHHNGVIAHKKSGGGFYEINTASHIDWPQQSRTVEIMDNDDGTISIFGTILDSYSKVAAPKPGPAAGFSDGQLGSLARLIAANDPQSEATTGDEDGRGSRNDRNVELVINDPRD